ncbi:hypothetical protein GCM10011508_00920 [Flavobacterium lutivivi]|nr:hypothetical protein GCM10011508_00920 [Flavobacterium lutivivi]HRG17922.1 hypothetical protein [Flavobacterium lutivivi]
MKLFNKTLFIIPALFLFSCSSDSSSSSGNCDSDINFMQTGKILNYSLEQFGFVAGAMKLEFGACDGTGVYSLSRKYFDTSGAETGSQVDKIKIEGDYMKIDVSNSETFYERLYKKNAQLGDTWEDTKADGTIYTREVIDVDSLITVPAGSFHCKVYKQTSSNSIGENYIFWNDEYGEIMEESLFLTLKLSSHN